jgi:hypothetical protein
MKNLMVIAIFLMAAGNIYSQADYFKDESAILEYPCKDYYRVEQKEMHSFLDLYYYLFEEGGRLFMLAYDKTEDKELWEYKYQGGRMLRKRTLLLYRLDDPGGWVQASDTVQIDYYHHNIKVIDFYLPEGHSHYGYINTLSNITKKGLTDGSVSKLENGIVVMNIVNKYVGNPEKIHRVRASRGEESTDTKCDCCGLPYHNVYSLEGKSYDCNVLVFLVPNGQDTFIATRFEPVLKKTNDPVLMAAHHMEVSNMEDGFMKVELWNSQVCEGEDCDGVVEIKGDGGVQKLSYKLTMTQKLYFTVNDDRTVSYVKGGAELIKRK